MSPSMRDNLSAGNSFFSGFSVPVAAGSGLLTVCVLFCLAILYTALRNDRRKLLLIYLFTVVKCMERQGNLPENKSYQS